MGDHGSLFSEITSFCRTRDGDETGDVQAVARRLLRAGASNCEFISRRGERRRRWGGRAQARAAKALPRLHQSQRRRLHQRRSQSRRRRPHQRLRSVRRSPRRHRGRPRRVEARAAVAVRSRGPGKRSRKSSERRKGKRPGKSRTAAVGAIKLADPHRWRGMGRTVRVRAAAPLVETTRSQRPCERSTQTSVLYDDRTMMRDTVPLGEESWRKCARSR